jgi:hypothetical protein
MPARPTTHHLSLGRDHAHREGFGKSGERVFRYYSFSFSFTFVLSGGVHQQRTSKIHKSII